VPAFFVLGVALVPVLRYIHRERVVIFMCLLNYICCINVDEDASACSLIKAESELVPIARVK
jgi:hypothetical protein